ncbi:hypothetical protein HN51_059093, partial [Arachis hypogaea]
SDGDEEANQCGVTVVIPVRKRAGKNSPIDHRLHVWHSPPHLPLQQPPPMPLPHLWSILHSPVKHQNPFQSSLSNKKNPKNNSSFAIYSIAVGEISK